MAQQNINKRHYVLGIIALLAVCFGSMISAAVFFTDVHNQAFAIVIGFEAFFACVVWPFVCDRNYKFSASDRIFLSIIFAPLLVASLLLFTISAAMFKTVVGACVALPILGFMYAKLTANR